MRWSAYLNSRGHPELENELDALLDEAPTQLLAIAWAADIEQRMVEAAQGVLLDDEESFQPVQRDPDLFELRLSLDGRLLRIYFYESGSELLALHAHWKDYSGTWEEKTTRQNAQMQIARNRLNEYLSDPIVRAHQLDIDCGL